MRTFLSLVEELRFDSKFQAVPVPYSDSDYAMFIIKGVRKMAVDIGDAKEYASLFDEEATSFARSITHTEREYILACAKYALLSQVQADVNTLYGYSTDSLTVTNADKPYANLANEKELVNRRLLILFHKLIAERGVRS